jgi:hypothetical protein
MSLLHREREKEIDDAARGESFTKGSSHVLWSSIIATVLVVLLITIYVITSKKPPAAQGEITEVWAHPGHVVTSGFDANGEAMAKQSFDQVLLFAHVKLRNQSDAPLVLTDVLANLTLGDGIDSISAGSAGQYEEVFLAYPELAARHDKPFSPRATIQPGENVEGTILWAVRMSKQQWEARKGLDFSFRFEYQPSLVLAPSTAVTEQ